MKGYIQIKNRERKSYKLRNSEIFREYSKKKVIDYVRLEWVITAS